ncbi:hypothetical protein CFPU101_45200 [Chroococcus sp. FPU101]|nr:hypothetical protein CFPU101_45200 [Chroococcus sp. FPU101]
MLIQLGCLERSMANHLPSTIFQHWIHSREEDTEDIQVYRPIGYQFPPSRGRNGLEFRPNGEFILYGLGPTDRPQKIVGSWTAQSNNKIKIDVSVWGDKGRMMEVISCDEKVLKLRYLDSTS